MLITPQHLLLFAGMAELADAPDLGSGVYDVQVQVLLPAPKGLVQMDGTFLFFCETFFHRGVTPLHDAFFHDKA